MAWSLVRSNGASTSSMDTRPGRGAGRPVPMPAGAGSPETVDAPFMQIQPGGSLVFYSDPDMNDIVLALAPGGWVSVERV